MSILTELKSIAETNHISESAPHKKLNFRRLPGDKRMLGTLQRYADEVYAQPKSKLSHKAKGYLSGIYESLKSGAKLRLTEAPGDIDLTGPDDDGFGFGGGFGEGPSDMTDGPSFGDDFVDTDDSAFAADNLDYDTGQTSFEDAYPEVDADAALASVYSSWLESVKSKQFYKTIAFYKDELTRGNLNFISRDFLWRFAKAISSAITHILIEAEQKSEAIILVQTYYDSLIECLDSVIYARDSEDIETIFGYMMDFLSLGSEESVASETDSF